MSYKIVTAIMVLLFTGLSLSAAPRGGGPSSGKPSRTGESMEKEFYNDYLDSLPDERVRRRKTLEKNLLRVAKKVIRRDDAVNGPAFAARLNVAELQYKKVTEKSMYVRGILKELKFLRPTKHMVIVKAGPYRIFVTFRVDPELYIVSFHQAFLVKKVRGRGKHEKSG